MTFVFNNIKYTVSPDSSVPDGNGGLKPFKEHLGMTDDEYALAMAEYTTNSVRKAREDQYPSIGDQLDALFHAGVFPPEMAALIQAVKDANPKPDTEPNT